MNLVEVCSSDGQLLATFNPGRTVGDVLRLLADELPPLPANLAWQALREAGANILLTWLDPVPAGRYFPKAALQLHGAAPPTDEGHSLNLTHNTSA